MARITIPDEIRIIDQPDALSAYLDSIGVHHERWEAEGRVQANASPDAILAAYAREIAAITERYGYGSADVIRVTPETSNLEAMLDRFRREHRHSEDEVRFIVQGRGLFFFHPTDGPVIRLEVEPGDFIRVPGGVRHWSDLCEERSMCAIRFFQDAPADSPQYLGDGVHEHYDPVCWSVSDAPTERVVYDWVVQV